ncbi:uncharacterized protein L201_007440 [Kwoniella dendrophila CBS 6074]|uniref:Uncharacterized protein n=1 Tax=Kwoniella dendrophila CBS 6074 TaxID=1295534 RepID=A0AAX4K4J3_9TREE
MPPRASQATALGSQPSSASIPGGLSASPRLALDREKWEEEKIDKRFERPGRQYNLEVEARDQRFREMAMKVNTCAEMAGKMRTSPTIEATGIAFRNALHHWQEESQILRQCEAEVQRSRSTRQRLNREVDSGSRDIDDDDDEGDAEEGGDEEGDDDRLSRSPIEVDNT